MSVAADGVVAVPGGGGEAAAGLVEREGEQLGLRLLRLVDAALPGGDLGSRADAQGGEDLDAGVAGVNLERRIRMGARAARGRGRSGRRGPRRARAAPLGPADGPRAGRSLPGGRVACRHLVGDLRRRACGAGVARVRAARRRRRAAARRAAVGTWRCVRGHRRGAVGRLLVEAPSRLGRPRSTGAPAACRRSDQLLPPS